VINANNRSRCGTIFVAAGGPSNHKEVPFL
jgi:hypothetical protein